MSVGFIYSSCTQLPLLRRRYARCCVAILRLVPLVFPLGGPVAESGADTSREGCGFPWFLLGITTFCACRSLTKAQLAGAWLMRRIGRRRESPGALMRPIFDRISH